MHRIYHDFNKVCAGPDDEKIGTAPLVCTGTKRDLEALGITLQEGIDVMLYMPDEGPSGLMEALEVNARVRYDSRQGCFVADYVLTDLMYQSEAEALRNKKEPNQTPKPIPQSRDGSP